MLHEEFMFIIRDGIFKQIKDLEYIGRATLDEFIDNQINSHPKRNSLMFNLSNLWVQVGRYESTADLPLHDYDNWKSHLDGQYEHLVQHKYIIVGFMWINEINIKAFNLVETLVARIDYLHIAKWMIMEYEKITDKRLLPYHVTENSLKYWYERLNKASWVLLYKSEKYLNKKMKLTTNWKRLLKKKKIEEQKKICISIRRKIPSVLLDITLQYLYKVL